MVRAAPRPSDGDDGRARRARRGVTVRDLLLRRARLGAAVRDVLVRGGRVAAVADDLSRAPGLRLGDHESVDLGGATLLPGLRDEHVHLAQWAAVRRRTDVSAATSAAGAADLVAAAWRAAPAAPGAGTGPGEGATIVAHGFRDALWTDAPHAALLDAALPGQEVVVVSADLHTVWCSTAAARRLGVRGEDAATGVVREEAAMALLERLEQRAPAALDRWVLEATDAAAARGVTAVVDLERGDLVGDWARRAALRPGGPAVRVRAGTWAYRLEELLATGLREGDPLPGTAGDPVAAERLRVGPVKVFVDGSLGTRTALCHAAYPGATGPGAHGVVTTGPDELERVMRRATSHGLEVAVHAIGDRAVTLALDAFAAVGCTGRIEHAQQVGPADLPRFAALGVVASVQPRHALDDRDAADVHWAGATDRAFPYGALVRAGAAVVLGSDAPVAPLDPWEGIASAVHRSADARPPWHPEQQLALADALAASSGGRRTVRVGEAADLVVLARPPGRVLAREGPDGLRAVPVLGTLVAGRWTHRAPALG